MPFRVVWLLPAGKYHYRRTWGRGFAEITSTYQVPRGQQILQVGGVWVYLLDGLLITFRALKNPALGVGAEPIPYLGAEAWR